MSADHGKPEERYEYGRTLREKTPLEAHAEWSPVPDRRDPVDLVEEQNEGRVPWLIPVRRVRMAASPFTFYRGSARIMATDLAKTPVSGIETQICGDAHLSNFGSYASPERRLVFDLNDFDETLPGPWEWDVKRLAASFVLAGRHNGLGDKACRKVARTAVRDYRKSMSKLATMRVTDVWYSQTRVDRLHDLIRDKHLKADAARFIRKTMRKDSRHALDKLAEDVGGEYRIRSEPPLLVPLRDLADEGYRDEIRQWLEEPLDKYLASVPDHIAHLLKKFRIKDFAIKAVGVGSVGTRCYILLLEGRDRSDPLFLQIKQATKSVLEEHLGPSRYASSGRRVVEGQRLMQTVSDIFLGHVDLEVSEHDFYWRQLKDWKGSVDVENVGYDALVAMARNRGWTLARSHARAGDPSAIAGYLDEGKSFDRAIVEFAERYADQARADHAAFAAQIESGRLEAAEHEYV
jgi:uncharacterized protein (DUF2252 family)